MTRSLALSRYLERHIEPALPEPPPQAAPWQYVLVIPACAEPPELLQRLALRLSGSQRTLVILVLNRVDANTDSSCNQALRTAIGTLATTGSDEAAIFTLNANTDLYLLDMEKLRGPSPAAQGVGLARKTGCDLALYWRHRGHIRSDWICSSDADADLPKDYFQRLPDTASKAVAATFPFVHVAGDSEAVDRATALYELRLHHYVLGLEYAHSPYAYHSLGSTLAIHQDCYAKVRGFPKRAGGEDFYLLNKAAKTGEIARISGNCIELESRTSARVPFGTGPAVAKIHDRGNLVEQAVFYDPRCFEALRVWLAVIPQLATISLDQLPELLAEHSLSNELAQASSDTLVGLGLTAAIDHCNRQGKSATQFLAQFHQWFDAFRTLKFIHGLRATQLPDRSLAQLPQLRPLLWPLTASQCLNGERLRDAIHQHWGWTMDQH